MIASIKRKVIKPLTPNEFIIGKEENVAKLFAIMKTSQKYPMASPILVLGDISEIAANNVQITVATPTP